MTRLLLWEEYRAAHPDESYSYSQFCFHYQQWQSRLKLVIRQTHRAGEKLFVDYAGPTVPIVNPITGEKAVEVGPHTRDLVKHLLWNKPHPEMGYRSCLGLLSLGKRFGPERLEAASERALLLGSPTRRSVYFFRCLRLSEVKIEYQEMIDAARRRYVTPLGNGARHKR